MLLILAGVAIASLTGENGILNRSKEATNKHEYEQAREEIVLAVNAAKMEQESPNGKTFKEALTEEFGKEPLATYNTSNIATATEKVTGTNREIYSYEIDLTTGEITDKESGEETPEEPDPPTPPEHEAIPETSYIGYYADVDGDEQADGVIYADLAVGGSGQWGDSWSSYSYGKETSGLKKYYVSRESYTGYGGKWTKPVLTEIEGSGEKDRFYVMALEDFNAGTQYYWYNSASGSLDDPVDTDANDFGEGRGNTTTMIEKWNAKGYGAQNTKDMWGVIQKADNKGKTWDLKKWFVPSKAEWAAFGDFAFKTMGVTTSTYSNYGLKDCYWSSAQNNTGYAYGADFDYGHMVASKVNYDFYVRLSATF